MLIEAKAIVGHGKFGDWLGENFSFTWQHACRYMKLAQNREALEAPNSHRGRNLADLTISRALIDISRRDRDAKREDKRAANQRLVEETGKVEETGTFVVHLCPWRADGQPSSHGRTSPIMTNAPTEAPKALAQSPDPAVVLSGRQAVFWSHYVETGNAAESARRLGCKASSARSTGSDMLRRIKRKLGIIGNGHVQIPADSKETFQPLTKQRIQDRLETNWQKALDCNQVREANHAVELLGRTIGLFEPNAAGASVNIAVLNDPSQAAAVIERIGDGEEQ